MGYIFGFFILSFFYVFIISLLFFGWKKTKVFKAVNYHEVTPVSVIIPFRNEQNNIEAIIQDVINQNYSADLYELILVNDHSVDKGCAQIENFLKKYSHIRLIHLTNLHGKKYAIEQAVKVAKYELIVTTDADCRVGENWLQTIVGFYRINKPKIIIGPVIYTNTKNLFSQFQSLEFLSLIAATAGAVGLNCPIMANGANLVFKKEVYLDFNNEKNKNIASGDDVHFIHEVKKKYRRGIMFLKSKEAVVYTKSVNSIAEFLNQRSRWAAKSFSYTDFDTIFVASVVFLFNVLFCFLLLGGIFNKILIVYAFVLIGIKSIIDFLFLYYVAIFFNCKHLLKKFLPTQLLYPFYIFLTVIVSMFFTIQWKGRKIQKY